MSDFRNKLQLIENIRITYGENQSSDRGGKGLGGSFKSITEYWNMLVLISWTILALALQATVGTLYCMILSKTKDPQWRDEDGKLYVPRTNINGEIERLEYPRDAWNDQVKHLYLAPLLYGFIVKPSGAEAPNKRRNILVSIFEYLNVPRFNSWNDQIQLFLYWQDVTKYMILALVITLVPISINTKTVHPALTTQEGLNSVYEYCGTYASTGSYNSYAWEWYEKTNSSHLLRREKGYLNYNYAQVMAIRKACYLGAYDSEVAINRFRKVCSRTKGISAERTDALLKDAIPASIDMSKRDLPPELRIKIPASISMIYPASSLYQSSSAFLFKRMAKYQDAFCFGD
jgi:hypothetical protein